MSAHLSVEFDARIFEDEVSAVLRGLRGAGGEPRVRAADDDVARLTRALDLYRGDFLEDVAAGDWAVQLRERLQRLHTDGLLALGGLHVGRGRNDEAADAFRRVIARDDLNEHAYRGLMQVLARTGHRADALRLYQRLQTLLRSELDAEPEPATVALLSALQ